MLIRHKQLIHERLEDAPFIGGLISSIGCEINCKGCFNQHLKRLPTVERTAEDIINEVKSNPFNCGLILGGLEWSEQYDEALELCKVARFNGMETMIYTGHTEAVISEVYDRYFEVADYIKCGGYDNSGSTVTVEGVLLASSNQKVINNKES